MKKYGVYIEYTRRVYSKIRLNNKIKYNYNRLSHILSSYIVILYKTIYILYKGLIDARV